MALTMSLPILGFSRSSRVIGVIGRQQPCLLWLVGQGASLLGVLVGTGGDGVVGVPCLLLGMLTADTSTTLVWVECYTFRGQ